MLNSPQILVTLESFQRDARHYDIQLKHHIVLMGIILSSIDPLDASVYY